MANTFTSTFEKYLSRTLQLNAKPRQVWNQVAGAVDDKSILSMGQQFSKSYKSRVPVQPYTRGSNLTDATLTTTDEVLTINEQPAFSFPIDDLDAFQSSVDLQNEYLKDSEVDLSNYIDGAFTYENAINASNTVDDGDFAGTSGNGIAITGDNVFEALSIAKRKLARRACDLTNLYMVASPEFCQVIEEQVGARETDFGDQITRMGVKYAGGRTFEYNGMSIYENLNTTSTVELSLATNPTNTDTVVFVINNVFEDTAVTLTFTFVSSIGSTAGNVLIAGTVDGTRANMATLMNDPGTTTANGVAFTGTSLWVAQKMVATNDDSGNTLTVRLKGGRFDSVSETLTDATDGFDSTKQVDNLIVAERGACNIVMQKYPYVEIEGIQSQFGKRVKGNALFGVKQFTENAKKSVRMDVIYT